MKIALRGPSVKMNSIFLPLQSDQNVPHTEFLTLPAMHQRLKAKGGKGKDQWKGFKGKGPVSKG
jgi:hypothetical protein